MSATEATAKMNATDMFAKHITTTNYDTLPVDVIAPTKKQILDTLGVAVAGSSSRTAKPLVDLVKEWGGKEESTIVAYGGRVPAPSAALANGMLSVVLDYDDLDPVGFIHVSRSVVPACFAAAEHIGGVNGKDFIASVALGFDLGSRISHAATHRLWLGLGLDMPGCFGAAASVGKLLKLSEEKTRNALSMALTQLCGVGISVWKGNIKGLNGGVSASGGVVAALMAEKGMVGLPDPFEGEGGYFKVFCRGLYTPRLLTEDLGKVFRGVQNAQKAYPCCFINGAANDATLALVREYDIKPEDVAEAVVHCSIGRSFIVEPQEEKQNPQSPTAAQFSIPWTVATAIFYRRIGIDHFTEKAIRDPKVLEMARKVHVAVNSKFGDKQDNHNDPTLVEIKTKNDQTYSKRVDIQLGNPQNPIDVTEKFRDCCAHAIKPISQENRDKVVQMVERLEEVADVGEIIRLLG